MPMRYWPHMKSEIASTPKRSRPILKGLGYGFATLIVVLALVLIVFDWNWLRHPIERVISENTGRALVIKGDLKVKLGWPLTRIQVTDVSFANPAWAQQPLMFTVKRIDGGINLLQLFKRHYLVSGVTLTQPVVSLEVSRDGRKNWLLDRNQQDENAQVKIGRIALDDGQISYTDAKQNTRILATLSTRQTVSAGTTAANIVFSAEGKLKGVPLTASGSGGTVLALNDETTPYPLDVTATLGATHVRAVGTVTSLTRFSAADLKLKLSGGSLDQLYQLIHIALPTTPAYSIEGHLLHQAQVWRYENFAGRIGKSDFTGTMQVDAAKKRRFLQGDLRFELLNLADLGSLVGVSKQAKQPSAKRDVLPKTPYRTDRWGSVDADVTFQAKHIQRAKALPIQNLSTRVQMHDSILRLDPLKLGVAGGTLAGSITLNGQTQPIQASVKLNARKLLLGQLFPTFKLNKASIGQINGEFDLTGSGDAVDQMLASANGKVALVIDGGEISKLMLETAGLHLWEILQVKMTGDKPIKLNCAVADFHVKQGVMQTRAMVLDTDITTIIGSGDIDLAQETLNLDLQPHTKVFSPLALRSPIYIRGKFAKPEVSLDKTKLILRGVGTLALGAINPFLALIPLVDTGPGKDSACGKLIHAARN